MRAVGVMSGTSADGIELAVVDVDGRRPRPTVLFLAHEHRDFSASVASPFSK